MAALVLILLAFVAVALVVVSLRALVVALEARRLTCRLKLLARAVPDQAVRPVAQDQLANARSCYAPIRVLYPAKRPTER